MLYIKDISLANILLLASLWCHRVSYWQIGVLESYPCPLIWYVTQHGFLKKFSRLTLNLGTNNKGQGQTLGQPRYSCPPRPSISMWNWKNIHKKWFYLFFQYNALRCHNNAMKGWHHISSYCNTNRLTSECCNEKHKTSLALWGELCTPSARFNFCYLTVSWLWMKGATIKFAFIHVQSKRCFD